MEGTPSTVSWQFGGQEGKTLQQYGHVVFAMCVCFLFEDAFTAQILNICGEVFRYRSRSNYLPEE